jgi:hypothetical protein
MSDSTQLPDGFWISPRGISFASTLVDRSEFLSFLAPPRILLKECRTAGSLCSTGVTPLPRYYGPVRHPSRLRPTSLSVIGLTSLHGISPVGGRDFSSCPVTLCSRAAAFTPPRPLQPIGWFESEKSCLRLLHKGSALGIANNEATLAFTLVAARKLAHPAQRGFVDGLRGLGLPQPRHPSYAATSSYRVGTLTL